MSNIEESISAAPDTSSAAPASMMKKIGLTVVFFLLLLFFTLTKLPQAKITALVQGYVQSALDPYGIYISDHGRELSIWKGFQYRLIQPTFELPDQSHIELEEMIVSPKLLSLFSGKVGATIEITQILERTPSKTDLTKIHIDGTGRGDLIDASINFDSMDIGKFGILAFAGGLKGSGQISGDIHVDGHLADLPSLMGKIDLKIKKLHLDEQNLFGFQLPTMDVNDSGIDAAIDHGKILFKQVQIGKSATDDLRINVTGDIGLNRNINSSTLNLRAVIGFSDKIKQSLSLLDSLMGQAKQADGLYVYKLTGSFMAPFPIPDPKK